MRVKGILGSNSEDAFYISGRQSVSPSIHQSYRFKPTGAERSSYAERHTNGYHRRVLHGAWGIYPAWLVLERKGENAIQARLTNGDGVIVSWDNYDVKNASVKQIEAVRLSVSGRSQILFTPPELKVIDRYGDHDRRTTMGKLDILLGRFKDEETAKNAQSVIDKLGRISDKSYTDMYYVGQKRIEIDKERSLGNRLAEARVRADKLNAESRHHTVERRKGMIR